MEKTKNKALNTVLTVLVAPLMIIVIILLACRQDGAFPFGKGTVAWCDMIQQTVPLLINFKDILEGKDGAFLNFHNASGTNMWPIIFSCLASPFSLLVVFVKKTDMLYFANILVMLKLAVCGGTASLYLKKTCKNLSPIWIAALGTVYGLGGYGLMYYQIVIWLDTMYIFPLLLLSMEYLWDKKRVLPYTLVLAVMMAVNYYIGYMAVIFIMLCTGLVLTSMRHEKAGGETALRFIIGSFMAALLSAVVWLPCIIQCAVSGRVEEEFFTSIKETGFLSSFETTLPLIFCSSFALIAVLIFSCDGKARSSRQNSYLILAFLTLIPIIAEPINLMWHMGSYMAFPSRFAFIPEFMLVVCAAFYLDDKDEFRKPAEHKYTDNTVMLLGIIALLYFFLKTFFAYLDKHMDEAQKFANSLWGDRGSLQICVAVLFLMGALFTLLITLYRKGWLTSRSLAILCAMLICCEGYANTRIYLTTTARCSPDKADDQNKVYDLADKIDDNSGMFRIKTDGKLFYVNLVGTLGYGSISMYSSLNSQDYMFMMKRIGYASNWMDVGSYGGTELTDMLMSIKYKIVRGEAENAVYSNGDYSIVPMEAYMESGLVLDSLGDAEGMLPEMTRSEIQKFIYDNTLLQYGESAVETYEFEDTYENGAYNVIDGMPYYMEIDVKGRQSLYFDAFDHPEAGLGSSVDDSFDIRVNGETVRTGYPAQDFNGLWKLGDFENEQVIIEVEGKRDIVMKSMGVVAIDKDKLYSAAANAQTVNFTQNGGKLTGSVQAKAGQYCLINVPYRQGLKVKVNGKAAQCRRVFDDLTAVELSDGNNEITVTSIPEGFTAGIIMTAIGAVLCALWHFALGKRMKIAEAPAKILMWGVTAAGAAVFVIIYIVPVIVNITAQE